MPAGRGTWSPLIPARQAPARGFYGAIALPTALPKTASDAADVAGGFQLIHELGREAVTENGDCLLLLRDRPAELPKP
jgi:hypothetical protein